MALERADYLSVLRRKYEPRLAVLLNDEYPLLKHLPWTGDLGAEYWSLPVQVSGSQRVSSSYATAKAQSSKGIYKNFLIPSQFDFHGLAEIENKILEGGDELKIADTYLTENDGAVETIYTSLEAALFRDGSGTLATTSAEPAETASTFTVLLASKADAVNFEPGMMLKIYSAAFGGSARTSDGSDDEWIVQSVNTNTGALVLIGTYDSSGSIAAGDFIQREGDHQANVGAATVVPGLAAWIPTTDPSASENFFNVDRSIHRAKLAGHVVTQTAGQTITEVAIDALTQCKIFGRRPTHWFVNPKISGKLYKELEGKVIQQQPLGMTEAQLLASGFSIMTEHGAVKVVPAAQCQFSSGWMLTLNKKSIELKTIGKMVKNPGRTELPKGQLLEDSDAELIRWVSRPAFGLKEPWAHCRTNFVDTE